MNCPFSMLFQYMYANGGVPYLDAHGNPYYKYEWLDNAGNVVDTNMTWTGKDNLSKYYC